MTYKIMIVEDESLERKALKTIISRNFQTIDIIAEAENGNQAIEFAKIYKPDMMLLDIGIPEMNGLAVQKNIIKFLPSIQTIIITAYSSFTYAQEAISSHVNDYLLKPVRPSTLVNSIHNALMNIGEKKCIPCDIFPEQLPENPIIQQAIALIKKNYMKDIRLDWIADNVHLNPQYLSRLFKRTMNASYSEFLTSIRLEKAIDLLLNSDYPIYRIANEVGFSDASYFCKVFVHYKKMSPHKFRTRTANRK
ncbi:MULTISPECIES: response regulator [Clostridia]|uniref:response regulator transcription factor n=1 Tax=Clostridia TaxID=186801 RepID=UPI000EA1008A|nr:MULTISPECIES: response regulator [Clostridia]NBJ68036.1 response regulator [Roseburia sp. 1XD42-34]RKI82477.1 response regulator [Clostridium sp. 1xD42-85]